MLHLLLSDMSTRMPFREYLPPNTSSFAISVPSQYMDGRKFHFEHLNLMPALYGRETARFKMEAEEKSLVYYRLEFRLEASFVEDRKLFFPAKFTLDNSKRDMNIGKFVQDFNNFFEREKPAFMKRCPVFLDWIDTSLEPSTNPVEEAKLFEEIWFGEEYDWDRHGNGLPASLSDLPAANQLKFLDGGFFDQRASAGCFRMRLFVAPFTRVTFSNFGPLQDMGSVTQQFGDQMGSRNYVFNNPTAHYVEMAGQVMPLAKLITSTSCVISLQPCDSLVTSYPQRLDISVGDQTFARLFNAKLQVCCEQLNVNFFLDYNLAQDVKEFKFHFPSSEVISLSVVFDKPDLPVRMGYHYNNVVTKTSTSQPMADATKIAGPTNKADAQQKCLSMCHDTGIVLCTLDQANSNSMSGALDYYMGSLYPTSDGIMVMAPSERPPGVVLLSPSGATSLKIPIQFQLLRIYDNQEIRKFAWKDGAHVIGTLIGTPFAASAGSPGLSHLPSARCETLV
jgi:hypothetical protein